MFKHDHIQICNHDVKYCFICDTCYCDICNKEWIPKLEVTYSWGTTGEYIVLNGTITKSTTNCNHRKNTEIPAR